MSDCGKPDPNLYFEVWAPQRDDIEAHWAALESLPPGQQAEAICTRVTDHDVVPVWTPVYGVHWRVILPHLDFPDTFKDVFWHEFSKPEAVQGRKATLRGLTLARRERALTLLEAAKSASTPFNRLLDLPQESRVGAYFDALQDSQDSLAVLGKWLVDHIEAGNFKIFEQIAGLLKGRCQGDHDEDEPSNDRIVLGIFITLHVAERTLPSKKAILARYAEAKGQPLTAVEVLERQEFSKQVNKSLVKFGLAGLPP